MSHPDPRWDETEQATRSILACTGDQALRLKENYEELYGWQSAQDFRWWCKEHLSTTEASELIDLSGGGYHARRDPDIAKFEARARELGWNDFTTHL